MATTKIDDFSFFDISNPLLTGGITADIVNDSRLYIENITSLPRGITQSGVPLYDLLHYYYNRRQNISAGQARNICYGEEFEFDICITNNAFLAETKLEFTTPAVCLNMSNKWGKNGYICKTRDFAYNLFEYLYFKIDDDVKVLGELSSDLMISNTYFDLQAGLREALYSMVGNLPDQIEPHAVGDFIPAYTYILPLKNCFNDNFANRFPLAALGITKTLKICGKLRNISELFILGNSKIINHPQPVVYIRPKWLDSKHGESQIISNFNLYYKASRVPDFDLNTMIYGGQQRNLCLEVFDPLPFSSEFDSCNGESNRYHLGRYANVHHIFFGIKNVTNQAEGSVYSLIRPQLIIAPTKSSLGRLNFNPDGNHSPYQCVEFTYNGISEQIDWRDMQFANPYEVCVSTPQFHTKGLGIKCFDPFNLHPQYSSNWPNGNESDIYMRIVPSKDIIEKRCNEDKMIKIEEFFAKGSINPITKLPCEDDCYIDMEYRIEREKFRIFVDVVTVKIFRIENGTIAPVIVA
jgi:hypothetical protein